jgi:hypothetical protein
MNKIIRRAFALATITLLACAGLKAQDQEDEDINPGVWSARVRNEKVYIQFGGLHWSDGVTFNLPELGPLPEGQAGSFTVKREPGTVTFTGTFAAGVGHGTYAFAPNPDFKAFLTQQGFKDVSESLMIHLFFTNINHEYFDYMKANGYSGITIEQLKHLAYADVNKPTFVSYVDLSKQQGWGRLSIDNIIEMHDHGASPAFVKRFLDLGYKDISIEQAVELVDHGVSADYIRSLQGMGYTGLTPEKAIELVDHGVSAEFIRGFQNIGYKEMPLDRAVELQDHGVSPEFVKSFKDLGFADLSLNKAVELQDHGVSADFIKRMQDKGLKGLSIDQYIRIHDAGM